MVGYLRCSWEGTNIKMTVVEVIDDLDKTSCRGVGEAEDWFQHLTCL